MSFAFSFLGLFPHKHLKFPELSGPLPSLCPCPGEVVHSFLSKPTFPLFPFVGFYSHQGLFPFPLESWILMLFPHSSFRRAKTPSMLPHLGWMSSLNGSLDLWPIVPPFLHKLEGPLGVQMGKSRPHVSACVCMFAQLSHMCTCMHMCACGCTCVCTCSWVCVCVFESVICTQ